MTNKIIVLITCGSAREAARIAQALVSERAAACVNILQMPVQSIYRWKGDVKRAKEVLLIVKTSRRRFRALERSIQRVHSYEVPEIIALPIVAGPSAYLAWLDSSVSPPPAHLRKMATRR